MARIILIGVLPALSLIGGIALMLSVHSTWAILLGVAMLQPVVILWRSAGTSKKKTISDEIADTVAEAITG